jgi:MarR family transcriptional regulator, transcriptional regulator for hemolysin
VLLRGGGNGEVSAQDFSDIFTEDDRAIFLMDEISRAARRAFDERVEPTGLNRTQWRVLAELIKNPLATQSDIAKQLDLESATIGLAVAALVDHGYIRRERGRADGRAAR